MSNMFLGTSTLSQAQASNGGGGPSTSFNTIDEMDDPVHCPEFVDLEDWQTHCRLRRKKIVSEEIIAGVMQQLAETEEVGNSRISHIFRHICMQKSKF